MRMICWLGMLFRWRVGMSLDAFALNIEIEEESFYVACVAQYCSC